jgi:hypothetical protein
MPNAKTEALGVMPVMTIDVAPKVIAGACCAIAVSDATTQNNAQTAIQRGIKAP